MKTRYILLGVMSLAALSCRENKLDVNNSNLVEMVFTASVENGSSTKTVLQPDRMSVWWSPLDSIRVFCLPNDVSGIFVSTNTEPVDKAVFRGSLEMITGTIDNENEHGSFIAVYPARFSSPDLSPGGVDLPVEQIAADNTFAKGMFPAVATSETASLSFYNICGGIVFTVDGEGIKTVTLSGNNDEPFAGPASVSFSSGIPSVHMLASFGTPITLKAPNGGTFTPGVRYFISVFPQTFENGFTLTFFKAASKSEVSWTKPATINRSRFLVLEHADAEAGEYKYAIPEEAYKDMDVLYDSFMRNVSNTAGIYVPARALFNFCGDDLVVGGTDYDSHPELAELNEFRYQSNQSIVRQTYSRYCDLIRDSNVFLKKYQNDLPEITGFARVFRAYAHMMLAIGWGTPPFMDHVLSESEKPYNCDRDPNRALTHEQLLEWCAQECEAAAQTLEERESPQDVSGAYRVTKGFAQAIAGKAYIFAGNYEKARGVLGEVVRSGKYALVPGERFWENFHIEGDGNEEKLFETNIEYYPGWSQWGAGHSVLYTTWMESNLMCWRSDRFVVAPFVGYTGLSDGWGALGVPELFAESFASNDGKKSYRLNASIIHIDDVIGGQMYGNSTWDSMTKEEKLSSNAVGVVKEGLYGQSLWLPFKQLIKATDANSAVGQNIRWNNYTIMRYAEVLLLYAEACIQTGDAAEALRVINQIQERAGSQTISTTVDMAVLKREKKYELWYEGCRWPDLVRWGDTAMVEEAGQNIPCLYDKFTRAPQAGDEFIVWEKGDEPNSRFYIVATHGAMDRGVQVGFVPGKHNYFPFPEDVILNNPNLVQNPGW